MALREEIAQLTRRLSFLRTQVGEIRRRRPLLCLFDLETTGLGKTSLIKICELGVVEYPSLRVHQWHVNPLQPVSLAVTRVHGLKNEFLMKQDPWSKVGPALNAVLEGLRADSSRPIVLGGFNSKRYDSRILTFENNRHGVKYPPNVFFVDFREIFPEFILLDAHRKKGLAEYHMEATGTGITSAHTAVADARAIANIIDTIEDREKLFCLIEDRMEASEAVIRRCFR